MARQMIMCGFRGLEIGEDSAMADQLGKGLGGVILFDYDVALKKRPRNIQNPKQIRDLTSTIKSLSLQDAGLPLLMGVDQEGGRVARLKERYGFPPPVPSARELGKAPLERTLGAGYETGRVLSRAGFNVDFAPVVDVNVDPDSPAIGRLGRSYSSEPEEVAAHGLAFIQGLHRAGVLSCIKHFPGHGSAMTDSHEGFTDVSATWSEKELIPYEIILKSAEPCDMVMTAHVYNRHLDPDHPATLSRGIIHGILRQRLQYEGVVVSDDMQMGAIRDNYSFHRAVELAVNAGVDILLYGNNLVFDPDVAEEAADAIVEGVETGRIPPRRVSESYHRITVLKRRLEGLSTLP